MVFLVFAPVDRPVDSVLDYPLETTSPEFLATLAGATTWTNAFAWPPPSTPSGYYCVRGSVTDTANQVTTAVNPFGIK